MRDNRPSEDLLHFIWQFRYFNQRELTTASGERLFVVDPGQRNGNQGPDFLYSRIRIGDTLLTGASLDRQRRLPMKFNLHLHIGMDTVHDRAGVRRPLQNGPLLFVSLEAVREIEHNIDTGYPPRIGLHDLLDGQLHALQVQLKIPCFYPHGGRHTGAQRRGNQISWGKPLPLPLVIRRCICLDFSAGLHMFGNRSQIPFVNNC